MNNTALGRVFVAWVREPELHPRQPPSGRFAALNDRVDMDTQALPVSRLRQMAVFGLSLALPRRSGCFSVRRLSTEHANPLSRRVYLISFGATLAKWRVLAASAGCSQSIPIASRR